MPRGLSERLAKANPHLTISFGCVGFESRCDLQESTPCQEIVHRIYVQSSSTKNGWEVTSFNPSIISCADCPIARNSKK